MACCCFLYPPLVHPNRDSFRNGTVTGTVKVRDQVGGIPLMLAAIAAEEVKGTSINR